MKREVGSEYRLHLIATILVLCVGLAGIVYLPRIWRPVGYPTEKALGVIEVYRAGTPTVTAKTPFDKLLEIARGTCPQEQPFVVLGDEVPLYLITDYYMYPRKVVRVRSDQPFELGALAVSDGCIGAYRGNVERVKPVIEQVEMIACSEDGCIYRVK